MWSRDRSSSDAACARHVGVALHAEAHAVSRLRALPIGISVLSGATRLCDDRCSTEAVEADQLGSGGRRRELLGVALPLTSCHARARRLRRRAAVRRFSSVRSRRSRLREIAHERRAAADAQARSPSCRSCPPRSLMPLVPGRRCDGSAFRVRVPDRPDHGRRHRAAAPTPVTAPRRAACLSAFGAIERRSLRAARSSGMGA